MTDALDALSEAPEDVVAVPEPAPEPAPAPVPVEDVVNAKELIEAQPEIEAMKDEQTLEPVVCQTQVAMEPVQLSSMEGLTNGHIAPEVSIES
jgi:hypothetical protein